MREKAAQDEPYLRAVIDPLGQLRVGMVLRFLPAHAAWAAFVALAFPPLFAFA